ncbi:glycosyltransferase [Mangrovibacterium diazotrophicum]|uniref:Glycosyltransferase involved in cell wall biosynthesis n=1 Tax=Mangrovibacterium diazotrophicum TaxID=1261403 RepID=A0A419VUL7_9BACT|nr:glycosyltransferase [Mangrovibacterium diazotrophicum]RKD85175.1 glycosyltransferase involved in cell wall biosynthesis [Mangrovibacterium diazotrophicum]
MSVRSKKIDIVVINDLVTDNRVHKVAQSLLEMGYTPKLTGRRKRKSMPLAERDYATHRMRLFFERGPLFYVEFNFRLFFRLLFSRSKIILSNDLDTLAASYFAAKLSRKKLVYDSHEYFTEVPELIDRPFKQRMWRRLEKLILPRLKNAFTVSQSIADEYQKLYGTPFKVIRNLPVRNQSLEYQQDLTVVPHEEKIVIYQGALNLGRGLEFAIQSMRFLQGVQLWLVGSGDLEEYLKILARQLNLQFKVKFFGQIPFQELSQLTAQADLGLSIEEDLGLNYRYALPNKLFDYIQHRIPVLVSSLPEMTRIVEKYGIGQILQTHQPEGMAKQIEELLHNEDLRKEYLNKLLIASKDLCWENEQPVLKSIFNNLR